MIYHPSDRDDNWDVQEIHNITHELDIDKDDARDIINLYFECFSEVAYADFREQQIKKIEDTEENQEIIQKIKNNDEIIAIESERDINRYYIITNLKDCKYWKWLE